MNVVIQSHFIIWWHWLQFAYDNFILWYIYCRGYSSTNQNILLLNRILPRDIFHFLSSLNCLHWDDISHWVDNGKVTEKWNVYDSTFQVLTIIKHFVTMSFTTLTKFVGNSVSGLWEGKSCEDSSWKLDTDGAGCNPNKGLFSSQLLSILQSRGDSEVQDVTDPSFPDKTSNYLFVNDGVTWFLLRELLVSNSFNEG